MSGRRGWSDRSFCWLVNCLDLPHFALRDHGSILVEVFIPRLFCLLSLLFVAKALELPLLSMCQPLWTPTGLMVLVRHLAATSLIIIGSKGFLNRRSRRSSRFVNHHRLLTLVLHHHIDFTDVNNSIGFGFLCSSTRLHLLLLFLHAIFHPWRSKLRRPLLRPV